MRFAALAVTALLAAAPAIAQTPPDASKWPVKDSLYVAHNFRFGTGETLPEPISTTSHSALRIATLPVTWTTPSFCCTAPVAIAVRSSIPSSPMCSSVPASRSTSPATF